ncbi:hypothetical protein INT48_005439, partial [Thamnidium elegans]
SSGEGLNKKQSSSTIRKYLVSPTKATTKPLACNDNVLASPKPSTNTNTQTTSKKTKTPPPPEKGRSVVEMLNATRSTITATAIINKDFPSMKRSYSAITHLDTANETWLNQPLKSRKRNYEKKDAYDRLTPKIVDMQSAQFIMNRSSQTTTPYLDTNNEGGSESYQEQVAKACGIEPTKRILSFTPTGPSTKHVDLRKNAPKPKLMTRTTALPNRHILSSPEKVLDAPYMDDDYYLNLLDWSSTNVVAVGLGKSVYLWSAETGSIQPLNYDTDDQVTSVSWSNDGAYLSVGTTGGDTQVWDVESNTKLRSMTGQECRIGVLSWDKHIVSSGGRNGSIWHHDVRMAKHNVRELYGHTDDVCGLKWRWDGQLLASGGNDDTVNIWDARSTTPKFTKTTHSGAIKALAWCPWKHNTLATGGGRDDKNIHFWDTVTGSRRHTIQTGSQVTSLNWSKHYNEIASTHGSPHNQVTVWEYPTLTKVIDIPAHESRILHSAMSPDGQVLATAAADDNLKFWRIFEANGKAPLGTERSRLTEKKESKLRRSHSIR